MSKFEALSSKLIALHIPPDIFLDSLSVRIANICIFTHRLFSLYHISNETINYNKNYLKIKSQKKNNFIQLTPTVRTTVRPFSLETSSPDTRPLI